MKSNSGRKIAIVGMSGRFPQCPSILDFWKFILNGKSAIKFFSNRELLEAGYTKEALEQPEFVSTLGSILERKDIFDAQFFGLTPNEALFLDPQIRIFLQEAWHALEDAGIADIQRRKDKNVGVFVGASNSFLWQARISLSSKKDDIGAFSSQVLVNKDYMAVQAAHLLNLTGPTLSVNTACSTSLVAVHMACQALINGECDQAMAGGTSLHYEKIGGYMAQSSTVMSPDGLIKAFDDRANGMVAGEGTGVVVLKRLEDALRDNDRIYAVIKASAINNDGADKAGFTTPSIQGQANVIKKAHERAGINVEQIQYVETHGSGTPIGDLVEMEALKLAFQSHKKAFCGVGSIKTNIGHTDAASGIAGFLKTVLATYHGVIPPSLNFKVPNSRIDWVNSPFYVVTEPEKISNPELCMGVSSFGIGGTNAHIIIETAPQQEKTLSYASNPVKENTKQLLVLSAKSESSLQQSKRILSEFLQENPELNIQDIAYTLGLGRAKFLHRWSALVDDQEDTIKQLLLEDEHHIAKKDLKQTWVLGDLFNSNHLDPEDNRFLHSGILKERDAIEVIFDRVLEEDFSFFTDKVKESIKKTLFPLLNICSATIYLLSVGLKPNRLLTPAKFTFMTPFIGGAISLEDNLKIVIGLVAENLYPDNYDNDFLEDELALLEVNPLDFDIITPLLEKPITNTDLQSVEFWKRSTSKEIELSNEFTLEDFSEELLIIIGKSNFLAPQSQNCYQLLEGRQEQVLSLIGELWTRGLPISFHSLYASDSCKFISLPGYAFEGHSFWLEEEDIQIELSKDDKQTSKLDFNQWFYTPSWERSLFKTKVSGVSEHTILFITPEGESWKPLVEALQERTDNPIVIVKEGAYFEKLKSTLFQLQLNSKVDFNRLFDVLGQVKIYPNLIVHASTVSSEEYDYQNLEKRQKKGLFSLISMMQALREQSYPTEVSLKVITNQTVQVLGNESLNPTHTGLGAAIKCFTQEITFLNAIQIDLASSFDSMSSQVLNHLVNEIISRPEELAVAYRNNYRWTLSFKKLTIQISEPKVDIIKNDGVYLLIGGLGNIGYTIAQFIAEQSKATIVLMGRSDLPEKAHWSAKTQKKINTKTARKIDQIKKLEGQGNQVIYKRIDIQDDQAWENFFNEITEEVGTVNGIFHMAGETKHEIIHTSIENVGIENANVHLIPKVYGLAALQKALEKYPVDFCVVTSSISAILGGLGFSAYAYANGFIDSFVQYVNSQPSNTNWYTINTAEWLFQEVSKEARNSKRIDTFMTPEEGLETYLKLLQLKQYEQIIISTIDLEPRLKTWVQDLRNDSGILDYGHVKRPLLEVAYAAPEEENEQQLVKIWSRILGYSEIGVNDNFFNLGGDSLKVIVTISNIHKELKRQIPVGVFFAKPTIRSLAKWLENGKDVISYEPILPRKKQVNYSLSPAQKRLYLINQIAPDNLGYNETHPFKIEGSLNYDQLEMAFEQLIARHESLRTRFELIDGDPVQIIEEKLSFKIESFHSQDINSTISGFVRPFNLEKAPLLRLGLIYMQENEVLLIMDVHHIIADGISINILFKELMQLYSGEVLEPLTIQYKDFVNWQFKLSQSENFSKQEKYWLDQFSKEWEPIQLPLDFKRPKSQSFEGRTMRFTLDPETSLQLRELANKAKATNFMVLLSIFQLWLSRLSGQEEVIIGTPTSGRRHADLQNMIGMFVNTLALRLNKEADEDFLSLLERTKKKVLQAIEYQEYPLEDLVEKVVPTRDLSRNPLFDVVFIYQDVSNAERVEQEEANDLSVDAYRHEQKSTKFDLILDIVNVGKQFVLTFHYAKLLFDKATIEQWINSFKYLCKILLEKPDKKVDHLLLMDEKSKERIALSNSTEVHQPNIALPQIFSRQAKIAFNKVALFYKDQTLTYGFIDQMSNKLAHYLIELGVQKGEIIALQMPRGPEVMISILGIMKAGAAYVPLNAKYPKSRVDYIMQNSQATRMLIHGQNFDQVKSYKVLHFEEIDFDKYQNTNPEIEISLIDPACLLYTSGSTGLPKGVVISHGSLMNFLTALNDRLPISNRDVILFKGAFVFDVCLPELFCACVNECGAIVALPDGAEKDPSQIMEAIGCFKITHAHFVNTMLDFFVSRIDPRNVKSLQSLKYVIQGGEVLPKELVETFREWLPSVKLINLYGPTEATVGITSYEVGTGIENRTIPIGKPINNTVINIVDAYGNSQPIGFYGEIWVTGRGLSTGYINKPELTRERFIEQAGQQWYRTGDYGRWLVDGNIEFKGRIDNQIKLHGNRIEIGEIENLLEQFKAIDKAVVLLMKDQENLKYLKAYLKVKEEVEISELRNFLSEKLPLYMIPTKYAKVESFPQTSSGKLDRNALRKVKNIIRDQIDDLKVKPRGKVELQLAKIWEDVLGLQNVSRLESFFTLGGDSIRALRVVGKMHDRGYSLSMKDILEMETIAKIANQVQLTLKNIEQTPPVSGVVPISPIQNWFFDSFGEDKNYFTTDVFLRSKRKLDKKILEKALNIIIAHHDQLRATFRNENGQIIQFIDEKVPSIQVKEYNLIGHPNLLEEVHKIAVFLQKDIQIDRFPLIRLGLFRLEDGDRLFMTIHHLITDTFSWRIILQNLENLLQQHYAGLPFQLPPKTDSYRRWVNRLSEYSSAEFWEYENSIWNDLFNRPFEKMIPHSLPVQTVERFDRKSFSLSKAETGVLIDYFVNGKGLDFDDIILAAIGKALYDCRGYNEICITLNNHGRESDWSGLNLSRTVGWFTSIYPVIFNAPRNANILDYVDYISEIHNQVARYGIGYGIKVYQEHAYHFDKNFPKLKPDIVLGYMGKFEDGKASEDEEMTILEVSEENINIVQNAITPFPLDIVGYLINQKLEIVFRYHTHYFNSAEILSFKQHFEKNLKELSVSVSSLDATVS